MKNRMEVLMDRKYELLMMKINLINKMTELLGLGYFEYLEGFHIQIAKVDELITNCNDLIAREEEIIKMKKILEILKS